jgi:hypothetical protein
MADFDFLKEGKETGSAEACASVADTEEVETGRTESRIHG